MGLKFRRGTTAQKSGSLAFGEPYVNTTLGTLQIGGESGDITLGASGTGSQGSFAGISGSSLDITGNAKIDGNLTLGGTITIGDNSSDNVVVNADLSSSIIPNNDNSFDLGSTSFRYRAIHSTNIYGAINATNGVVSGSSQVVDILSSLNSFSASENTKSSTLALYTASVDTKFSTLQTLTASMAAQVSRLQESTASLNAFSASENTKSETLRLYTASVDTKFSTLATYTGSNDTTNTTQNTRLTRLEESTASLNAFSASENTKNSTLGLYTASVDAKFTTLQTLTASMAAIDLRLQESTASLNAFTNSFNSAIQLTGSNVNIAGNLTIAGTTTTVNSTNVAIADSVIELNYGGAVIRGGILVKDGTGGSNVSGSLLWDGTNDQWIAGVSGSESKILRAGSDGVISGSSQVLGILDSVNAFSASENTKNSTLGLYTASVDTKFSTLATYTGSNDTTNTAQSARLTTIESVTGSYETKGRGIVSGSAQIDGSLLGSNKTITIGSTSTTLGGTSTTLAGLTSVTSTAFVGALTGNASTVTTNANLTGNVTSVGNATTIASGVVTSDMIVDGTIVNGDINASAAIVDTKLATIATAGKVSNSATTATNANTVSAIVARDGSGNFSAGTITAALTGNASTATTAAALTTARTINGTSFDGSANITIPNLVSGSSQIVGSSITTNAITIAGTSTALGGAITAEQIRTAIGTVVTGSAQIAHDSTTGFSANKHIDHTAVTLTAGDGLTGGGDISASRTFAVGAGTGISVAADSISNTGVLSVTTNTGLSTNVSATGNVTITNSGVTSNVAGTAISVSGATGAVTITNTGVTSNVAGTGVTVSGATGAVTISIGQAVATSDNVRFNSLGIGMAASATAGRIDATNDIVAYSSSDIRFKENIVPIENALDKISKISGNTYDWKEENKIEHGYEGNDVGVIAQEIEAVLPQLVQTRENGFKAVKYDKLVALLIEGIKEQQTQIEKLRMDLDNYECKCDNCKSK